MNGETWINTLRANMVDPDGNTMNDRAALFAETIAQHADDDGFIPSTSFHEWRKRTGDEIGWKGCRWALRQLRRAGWLENAGHGDYGCNHTLAAPDWARLDDTTE